MDVLTLLDNMVHVRPTARGGPLSMENASALYMVDAWGTEIDSLPRKNVCMHARKMHDAMDALNELHDAKYMHASRNETF